MSLEVAADPAVAEVSADLPSPAVAGKPWDAAWTRLKRLPRWFYLSAASVALIATIIYVCFSFAGDPAKLRIVCQHNFRSAELSVIVDSRLVYSGTLSGNSKKRFGLFDKNAGANFSKVVGIGAGSHAVQVHLSAPAEGFDQAKVGYADFSGDRENVLVITSARRTGLNMAFSGGALAKAPVMEGEPKSYSKSAFSILLSVLGTMLSASISFLVQEFWRRHRAALTK